MRPDNTLKNICGLKTSWAWEDVSVDKVRDRV